MDFILLDTNFFRAATKSPGNRLVTRLRHLFSRNFPAQYWSHAAFFHGDQKKPYPLWDAGAAIETGER